MMYYIYHVPGEKIGCSTNPRRRVKAKGYSNYEILEEHEDIYVASDREIELQEEYGYGRDNPLPYYKSVNAGAQGASSERARQMGNSNTHEELVERASLGGLAGGKKGGTKTGSIRATCRYCGMESNISNVTRHERNTCKKKPQ